MLKHEPLEIDQVKLTDEKGAIENRQEGLIRNAEIQHPTSPEREDWRCNPHTPQAP